MCGIAGIARRFPTGVSVKSLGKMAASIRHRGPDGYGFYLGQRVGFAHVRLSVVDLTGGAQPLTNENGQIVVTYNGEIYNHLELRRELEKKGHIFRTHCDTEILVHGYEEWGVELLKRLNGQFAFAIYDRNTETVFIARDRFGVRPLFYAQRNGEFYFGSEIKAILASGEVEASVDRRGIDEVFTFWAARPPRTPFAGIAQLEPGTYGILKDGALWLHRYYELDYPEADAEPAGHDVSSADRTEHVVAAAGADEDVTQLKFFAQGRAQQTGRSSRGTKRWKLRQQILVDKFGERLAPGARLNIKQSSTGGVTVFHLTFAGEPEIQKIMGQKNGASMREIFRLVFFQPQNFRRGVAGHHGIASAPNEFVDVSEGAI